MNCDKVDPIPKPDIRHTMACRWCGALMVKERLYDYVENDGQPYAAAWTWVYRSGTCGRVLSAMRFQSQVAS